MGTRAAHLLQAAPDFIAKKLRLRREVDVGRKRSDMRGAATGDGSVIIWSAD